MYHIVNNMPENIIGLELSGHLSAEDLEELIVALKSRSHLMDNMRLLILMDDFEGWPEGAIIEVSRFLLSERSAMEQIALVGGEQHMGLLVHIAKLIPGIEIQRFDDESAARDWLTKDSDHWTVDPLSYKGEIRQPKDMRILIVGAGPAGLTLGSMLQQRGMSPTIIEDAPEFGKIGYVIILMSAGGRILKGLDGYENLSERGVQVHSYDIASPDGEVLRENPVGDLYASMFGDSFSIYRPTLVDVIKNTMPDQSVIRMGTTVDAIEQDNDEVRVTFSDGSSGTFDLVVGTDGLHSKVRQLIFGDEIELDYTGLRGWAWWGEKDERYEHRALEYWGLNGAFGLYPTDDRLCVVGVVKDDEHDSDEDPETRKQRIREHFGDWQGEVPFGLDQLDDMDPEDIFHDHFYYGNQTHWYRGRVVLAGDAVHPFSPISGMGASMAMESASVLAEELCYVDSRFIDQALRKYQERRKFRVTSLQHQAQAFENVVTSGNPLAAKLRELSLKHIDDGLIHHFLARVPYQPV